MKKMRRHIDNLLKICFVCRRYSFFFALNWIKIIFNFSFLIIVFLFIFNNVLICFFKSSILFSIFSSCCCVSHTIRCKIFNIKRIFDANFDVVTYCLRQTFISITIFVQFVFKTKNKKQLRRWIFANLSRTIIIRFLKRSKN